MADASTSNKPNILLIVADDLDRWDLKMSVYAAMVDRMDQGIGRVLGKLRELGKEEESLVLFLSDNGGCGERVDLTPERSPGTVDTYCSVGAPWANVSNTPFRLFKVFDHEGGISTPFIARWPQATDRVGNIDHTVGHEIEEGRHGWELFLSKGMRGLPFNPSHNLRNRVRLLMTA